MVDTINKHLLQAPNFECEICNEAITNPICPVCLTEEVNIWSTLYPSLRHELMPRLKQYLKTIKMNTNDSSRCIKCHRHRVALCSYCFIREVLEELEDLQVNRDIKKEFLQFFNYDLGHTSYKDDIY
ncbi:hypothetical protein GOV14_01425 [Candidatus Pacearchaeota archaeon]|nr:hypothetical protein [Candidatus Pacearchaeota archaeon]